jgi:hypothetical protein
MKRQQKSTESGCVALLQVDIDRRPATLLSMKNEIQNAYLKKMKNQLKIV